MLRRHVTLFAALATLLPLPVAASEPLPSLSLEVRSSRAHLISGGDAIVRVSPASVADLEVEVAGRDVSDAFTLRPNGQLEALLSDLPLGGSTISARAPGYAESQLPIVNHPSSGPLFSGPHLMPWTCSPGALDDTCAREVSYSFFYRSLSTDTFEAYGEDGPAPKPGSGKPGLCDSVPRAFWDAFPYSDSGYITGACERTPPSPVGPIDPTGTPDQSDVATTKTEDGATVPFIVRLEEGIVDRDRYQIAVLFDPRESWDRWQPPATWNHKLVIAHGHGCGATYGQGEELSVLEESRALGKGFAVMNTALNNSGSNCNPVVQAESMFMAKERVIEAYGDVRYTIGTGGSGGALAQQWVANAYPGLYDGLLLGQSFPDAWTTLLEVEDCALLLEYWQDPTRWAPGVAWTEAQKQAVEGHLSTSICQENVAVAGFHKLLQPSVGRSCGVKASEIYEPTTNPRGVRCTLADYSVNVLGRRPASEWSAAETAAGFGFAGRPYDNIGVQYGLHALRAGRITPAQFLDLNGAIGSHDLDYRWQPQRVAADRGALHAAYRAGLINSANELDQVAIIDKRGTNTVEIHHHVRTWQMRARLDRSNGHHDNHVIWWGPVLTNGDSSFSSQAFDTMNTWLASVEADASGDPIEVKIVRNKPAAAVDRCTNGRGEPADPATCQVPDSTPRIEAGGPLTDDVIACELRAFDRSQDLGPVPFTEAQLAALEGVFSAGVCDFTRPGVGQQPTVPWLDHSA